MAKKMYIGVDGIAQKVKKGYVGVDGVARKVKKAYIGVGGIARPFWSGGELGYYGTIAPMSDTTLSFDATTVGDYALFGGGYPAHSTVDTYNSNLVKGVAPDLSTGRPGLVATSVSNYALFAGGYLSSSVTGLESTSLLNIVDTYSTNLVKGNAANLSSSLGYGTSATTVGNYALFAGGRNIGSTASYSTVDTYNSNLVKGVAPDLSTGKFNLRPVTVGNYAFFAGGIAKRASYSDYYAVSVDIYNPNLVKSTAPDLSVGREWIASTAAGDYALFSGGKNQKIGYSTVDAYNPNLVKSTAPDLLTNRYQHVATSVGNYALFGGGYTRISETSQSATKTMEIYNNNLVRSAAHDLTGWPSCTSINDQATTIGDYALFAASGIVDVYTV